MPTIKLEDVSIDISQEDYNKIKKQFTKEEEWPKIDDEYFYIARFGEIISDNFNDCYVDRERKRTGNMFRTKEEAEKERDKILAIQRVKDYIKKEFGVFEPDWNDNTQVKYCVMFHYNENIFNCMSLFSFKLYSPFGYLKSEGDCKKLTKDKEEDLRIIFEV